MAKSKVLLLMPSFWQ
ncbi:Protein of unknown function [Lactobacillus delbrueckii subsp. lactis]|nr:Protein of unknown function [Lactobacillus delbrueckii subsp. lactis]